MITRIAIDGFKSFRQFSLELEPLQIIAGPNSAGKSNLFDAVQLLARSVDLDIVDALARGRGKIHDQFARHGGPRAPVISLSVDLLLPEVSANGAGNFGPLTRTRVRYQIGIERRDLPSGDEEIGVAWESLTPVQQADDAWMDRHPELAEFALYGVSETFLDAGPLQSGLDLDLDGKRIDNYKGPGARIQDISSRVAFRIPDLLPTTLLNTHGPAFGPHIAAVRKELQGWRFPLVDLVKMRQPSERVAAKTLASDGSNLPAVLAALPLAAAHVRADLADLVPGVRSFEIVSTRDDHEIEVELSDGEKMPARVLSDGTLRLLGLLTLVRTSPPGAVIAHEEPENGIFPGRLRDLLEKVLVVTSPDDELPVQLLLNSHSPVVLSVLRDRPQSIVLADLVRHPDGARATRMRHVAADGAEDRGATTVSRREVERALDLTRAEESER